MHLALRPLLASLFLVLICGSTFAHEGHSDHSHQPQNGKLLVQTVLDKVLSSTFKVGDKTFRWEHRDALGKQPEKMAEVAKGTLHNSADQDLKTNEICTVVAKYGLVVLDAELKEWTMVENQDPKFAAGMNAHGADCFMLDDESYWTFASTNTKEVVVCKRGEIVATLSKPKGTEFNNDTVNKYYADGGAFVPCDVVYAPQAQSLIVVTGYAPGDYALSAKLVDGTWQWTGAAWGGKVNKGGPFSTAHGVEVTSIDGKEVIEIASRGHGRIIGFTAEGEMVSLPGAGDDKYIELPKRSNPCNVYHAGSEIFLPLLNPLADTNGLAPVLIIADGKPTGQLIPAEYEGLELMVHMHGFCPVQRGDQLFGVVLSWRNAKENKAGKLNDGQITVFEAVEVN